MKNHILVKSLLFSLLVGMACFLSFKGHAADLHNVQTIGQKNRNQAVGQGLQVGDSSLCKGAFEADSTVKLPGLHTDVSATQIIGRNGANSNVGIAPCGCILHVRDSISSAQILNSHSAPVTLIAAPGSGYVVTIVAIKYTYVYAKAAYTLPGGPYCGLVEGDLSTPTFIDNGIPTELLALTATNYGYGTILNATYQTVSYENQAIKFYSNAGNPTTGGGYLIVTIDYIIEAV